MEIPGLADKAGGRNIGPDHRVQPGIIGCAAPAAAGHAKGDHARGAGLWRVGEESIIRRVGPRPSALDIVDADFVQRRGNGDLVGLREIDAASLTTVAKRRVKQPDPVIAHPPVPRGGIRTATRYA